MVQYALKHSKSEAARLFGTTRDTVRKWVERYLKEGTKGLMDRPKRPKTSPNKIPDELEQKILSLRDKFPSMGPERLKMQFSLPCSTGAIYRVLKQNSRIKPRRKKYQRKRDLRHIKALYRPFEKIQIDVKELDDIVELYPALRRYNLPVYEYTARCVKSGASFICFGFEKSLTNSTSFARYVLSHLKGMGIEVRVVQTDNGGEFTGSWQSREESVFTKLVEGGFGIIHRRIPPSCRTWNSDVEAYHRLIEEEFYRVEVFDSLRDFLCKAYTYNLYFNYLRKNGYKGGRTPWEIVVECMGGVDKRLLSLPPVILDYHPPWKTEDLVPEMDKR